MMEDFNFNDDSSLVTHHSPSLLHPNKYDHEHIARLQVFSDDLQSAIKRSFPRREHPYSAVHVLLLRWAEDDLNVQYELTKLRKVFKNQFNFETEQWDIPSQNPTRKLQAKLYDFQNAHQCEDELLIVYYGGHGKADPQRGRSIWCATSMADSPSLTWSSLQHLLENAIPHVLIILDCCFAANAARDTTEGSTKEILAACGRENPTSGVGIRSFTAALLEELQAFGQRPFTVAMLHTRLVTMRWRLAFTPIYALLSEHGGHSIEISPLPIMNIGNPSLLSSHSTSSVSSADPMNLSSSQDDSMFSSSTQPSSQSSPPRTVTNTRVLLAVSIADDAAHDISEWKTWLTTQTPWDVTRVDVRVEAVFESHSTMLLASVPIYAWDILPDRTAYLFVGFIRSGNIQQPHSSSRIASQALKNWGVPVLEMTPSPSEYQRKNPKGRERPKRSSVKGSMVHHNDKESTPTIFSRKRSYQETIVSQVNTEDFTSTPSIASTIRVENSAVEHEPLLGSYDVPDHYSHDTQKDSVNSMMYSNIEVGHQQGKVSTAYVEPSKAYPTPSASANTSANNSANNSSAWSTEDDAQLMRARREGLSWARTAHDYLNAKTANACRKRYERLVKKPNSKEWDPFESETSAKAYIEVREQMWRILADKLGVKWQTVEAQCMAVGLKTLAATDHSLHHVEKAMTPIDLDDDPTTQHTFDSGIGIDSEEE